MFDRNKFRAKVVEIGITLEEVSKELKINPATLYRKMSGKSDFSRQEIQDVRRFLKLDDDEVNEIFFAPKLTQTQ